MAENRRQWASAALDAPTRALQPISENPQKNLNEEERLAIRTDLLRLGYAFSSVQLHTAQVFLIVTVRQTRIQSNIAFARGKAIPGELLENVVGNNGSAG